jgi:hypothetical protein
MVATHIFKVVVAQELQVMVVVTVVDTLVDPHLEILVVLVVEEVLKILAVLLFILRKVMLVEQDKILEVLFRA